MKVSDYMVRFLEEQGVTDVFGIPGVGCGHFMNSMIGSKITSHLTYHEQGAAFAACGYAQTARRAGFAYTTAGPGGTNLITGIANAYADSIPTVFMVGEKDLASLRGDLAVRQRASQEVDIVSIAASVTKWSYQVTGKADIRFALEKAFYLAEHGRPGPVLLDIPSDIQRAEIDDTHLRAFTAPAPTALDDGAAQILAALAYYKKPVFLIGNGVKQLGMVSDLCGLAQEYGIPIVTTLTCMDIADTPNILGFIGMDGDPAANRAVHDCDLLITFGARLNFKQTGNDRAAFAIGAKIIRVDCDEDELSYRLRDEDAICADLRQLIPVLIERKDEIFPCDSAWLERCLETKDGSKRKVSPNLMGDNMMRALVLRIPENTVITVDTGSHRRWLMATYQRKWGQQVCQSAGLASMGYGLPAAIGAFYGSKKPVVCINGDGGIMMNLQELQTVAREQLPVSIIVFNNHCLGDIMEFQKKIFTKRYFTTTEDTGYQAADFEGIAKGFHLPYRRVLTPDDFRGADLSAELPQLIEVIVPSNEA